MHLLQVNYKAILKPKEGSAHIFSVKGCDPLRRTWHWSRICDKFPVIIVYKLNNFLMVFFKRMAFLTSQY